MCVYAGHKQVKLRHNNDPNQIPGVSVFAVIDRPASFAIASCAVDCSGAARMEKDGGAHSGDIGRRRGSEKEEKRMKKAKAERKENV